MVASYRERLSRDDTLLLLLLLLLLMMMMMMRVVRDSRRFDLRVGSFIKVDSFPLYQSAQSDCLHTAAGTH